MLDEKKIWVNIVTNRLKFASSHQLQIWVAYPTECKSNGCYNKEID